jgi:hypothetical protein
VEELMKQRAFDDEPEQTAGAPPVNGVQVKQLFDTIAAIKATPGVAKFKFRIRNEWIDAGHNRSSPTFAVGANFQLILAESRS